MSVISIVKQGDGTGLVTSDPAGIDCGITCSHDFSGDSAELTATPDAGSVFGGWSEGTDNPIVVNFASMSSFDIRAYFNLPAPPPDLPKVKAYVAPQIGTGTMQDPYRSKLNNYITKVGEYFSEIDHPARKISMCIVHALESTHNTINADSEIFEASPLCDDEVELKTKLQILASNIPNISVIKNKLEAIGINTAWASGSNTLRDILRYLLRVFTVAQITEGENAPNVRDFLKEQLDTQIKDVPPAVKSAVSTWMQNKGLAMGWITNSTTVREVVHFIVENLGIGVIKLHGEDF